MPPLRLFFAILFAAVFTCNYNIAFGKDSLTYNTQNADTLKAGTSPSYAEGIPEPDDEFNIGLLIFATAAICIMLGFVIAGMLTFTFLLLLFIAFVATGVLSVSVFTGLYKRSVTSGFKTFMIISGSIMGLIFGILVMGTISLLFKFNLEKSTITLTGGLSGILADAVLGLSVFKLLRIILIFFGKKLHIQYTENTA